MATDLHADTEDMAQLMELLKEYTEKLRTVCNEMLRDKLRMIMLLTLFTTGAMTLIVLIIYVAFNWNEKTSSIFAYSLPVGILISFITTPMAVWLMSRYVYFNAKRHYDAQHFVRSVTQMVASASQYSEHAAHRIGDKFTFDLRLAEAESVLMMYKSIARRSRPPFTPV